MVDLLTRDHLRMDRLLSRALQQANAGDLAGAEWVLRVVAGALRRRIRVENEVIVPLLDLPRHPGGQDPASIMLR